MKRHLLTLALLLSVAPALCANWPAWRGPDGSGVSPEKGLPVQWSPTENVRWKVPLSGAGVSTPVVWGERVVLTASDGPQSDQLHVLCFHRNDGRRLWHARFFGTAVSDGQFAPGGMGVPSPVTDGRRLFVLFGTGDLFCLDMDGKPLWVRSLAQEYGPFRNRWGMAASPLLLDDLLVIQVDHWAQSYLLGVDTITGANRWRTPREAAVNWTSPLAAQVRGQAEIVAVGTHRIQGYDPRDGRELWNVTAMQQQCIPSPVQSGDVLYAVSGREHFSVAVKLDGGRGDLTKSHVLWRTKSGATFTPSPVCYEGLYYYVEDNGWGNCLDAATGERRWRERMRGTYRASLAAGDGKVYFTSLEGVVTVVKAGPKLEVLARNDLGEGLVASPAFSRRQLFLRGEKHLYCIEAKGP